MRQSRREDTANLIASSAQEALVTVPWNCLDHSSPGLPIICKLHILILLVHSSGGMRFEARLSTPWTTGLKFKVYLVFVTS